MLPMMGKCGQFIKQQISIGWNNIQYSNLKTTDSTSLPIYISFPEKEVNCCVFIHEDVKPMVTVVSQILS